MHKPLWPISKQANRGFRGYPAATVAFYGLDDQRASKIAIGVVRAANAEVTDLERWFSDETDIRDNVQVIAATLEFLKNHGIKTVISTDRIIGCPHEEGKDYPSGEVCPQCPFWANRDRWTGEILE